MSWRGDLVVIAICATAVALSAALAGAASGPAHTALIEASGAAPRALPLDRDATVTVRGLRGESVIEVQGGRARFVASECPGKLCIRSGWLERAGDAAACVPNGVSLSLVGDDPAYDAVTY